MPVIAQPLGLFDAIKKTPSGIVVISQPHTRVGRRMIGKRK
jgi:hypothetical protein